MSTLSGRRSRALPRRRFVPLMCDRLENRVALSGTQTPIATYTYLSADNFSLSSNIDIREVRLRAYVATSFHGSPDVTTGTITIYAGSTPIDTEIVYASGTEIVTRLPAGAYTFTAVYSGDSDYAPSTSVPRQGTVYKTPTDVTLGTSTASREGATTGYGQVTGTSKPGQPVTFTAFVNRGYEDANPTGSPELPTGTVTFSSDGTEIGTAPVINSVALLTTSSLGVGTHLITATYTGDQNFDPGNSVSAPFGFNEDQEGGSRPVFLGELHQTVGGVNIALTSSANPTPFGSTVEITVTVTGLQGPTPTGTVILYDNSNSSPVATLVGGQATFREPTLNPGTNTLSAYYNGDANYAPAYSSRFFQFVGNATPVVHVGNAEGNPWAPKQSGEPFTIKAWFDKIGTGYYSFTPSGQVTFYVGSTAVGSAYTPYRGDPTITITTSVLGVGTYQITAMYEGGSPFNPATSAAGTLVVTPAGTGVSIGLPAAPVAVGTTVTLTAAVTSWGAPSGPVVFYDGSTVLGTATLSKGTATLNVSSLAMGTHAITVRYLGDANDLAGTSTAGKLVIGTANERFLNQLDLDLLDRPIDPTSLAQWEGALNAGVSRSAVVLGIASSREYALATVKDLSRALVGEGASMGMIGQAVALQAKGLASPTALEAIVLDSPEFYKIRGGGTGSGFVTALGRVAGTIDAGSTVYFARLAAGGNRSAVVASVLGSDAGLSAWVNGATARYLGRPPKAVELHTYVNLLKANNSSSALLATLLGTDEFFERSTTIK